MKHINDENDAVQRPPITYLGGLVKVNGFLVVLPDIV
jgi:hypothetical protein